MVAFRHNIVTLLKTQMYFFLDMILYARHLLSVKYFYVVTPPQTGKLKRKQLNRIQPSLTLLFKCTLCQLWHVKMCSIKRIRIGRRNVLADVDCVKSNHRVCFWLSAAGASTLFGWLYCCSGCSWVEKRSGGDENHWCVNCLILTAATKQDCEETCSPKTRSDWSNKWNVENGERI